MKIMTIALLLALFASTSFAGDPARKTVVIRYQPPAETFVQSSAPGLITEADVMKAYRTLKSSLGKAGMDVQLGTIARPEGIGKLWIGGYPLETWLNERAENPDPSELQAVTSEMIVQAGLAAGARVMNGEHAAKPAVSERIGKN